ncbi:hypothetical protein BO94DRAFT_472442 [Aspergillus sclerotioniger CBS 115572]|uniref:Uncharacterized protein n=1 Tax=Aspergillus sclerotioniger CBS 115572 TaxID=1450535 RepID=A0A317VX53_9EURO|nr:hypothetical protein BO94DRAFT_472442 [Aspergillus sclerotioniger CBS 115572]PWY78179.1 hypothetical protein BO94DRAFT_472442 [Aspergillus sclerotioniger CBS 115572]
MHRMPLLRKASYSGSSPITVDLSRSSFEQEGLGIYTTHERAPRGELISHPMSREDPSALHRQSTSAMSQVSTASSPGKSKPGSQYVHPMRLAPRAYTPPLNQSCQASVLGSDDSHKDFSTGSNSPMQLGSEIFYPSSTRSPGVSQTNITGRSSFGYSRDNASTLDTTSPVSRSSLDFVFRSKTRTSMDPVARAATVQAARQAFEEKEAAKTWRFEAQQMKAEEKQSKQREKQHLRTRTTDDDTTWADRGNEIPEKPQLSTPMSESSPDTWKSQPKNTWVLFLTWLRTRIFKLRRRIGKLV